MKHRYFQLTLSSFLGGVFLSNMLEELLLIMYIVLLFLLLFVGITLYIRQYRQYIFPFIIGIVIGIMSSLWTQGEIQRNLDILGEYSYGDVEIVGSIVDIEKRNQESVEYRISIEKLSNHSNIDNMSSLLRIPSNFVLGVGDRISYTSPIYLIEDFEGFSYQDYMLSQGVYFRSYVSRFDREGRGDVAKIFVFFSQWKQYFLEKIDQLYPETEGVFLGGILLGAREDLSDELKENFNNSGLTHFIAVSGFNITILVIFFGFLFQYFPLTIRLVLVVASIVSFTLLVGTSPPVVRAAIMGIIGYIVLSQGRTAQSLTLILITASAMTLYSPLSLNYDVSLHLSFLAVVGIVYTQGFFKYIFSFLPDFLAIREAFVLTLAALSLTLPIMMFQFGQVSLLAPIANIAVTWTIPIAMLLGFLSLCLFLVFPPLGYGIGFFAWIFLKYDMLMVEFFGGQEFALLQIDIGAYSIYIQALYFIVLVFCICWYRLNKKSA